jgi:hypothetical protein
MELVLSDMLVTKLPQFEELDETQKRNYDRVKQGAQSLKVDLFHFQAYALSLLASHKIVVVCVPKRQGKTTLASVAVTLFATIGENKEIIILSTSREHASSVLFRRVVSLFKTLPTLKRLTTRISRNRIELKNNVVIETVPCTVSAVAGRTYDLLCIDEIALIEDYEVVNVILSQSEKPTSRILITSTAAPDRENPLYRLYELAQTDDGIAYIYLSGEEAFKLNPLISRDFVERQRKIMTAAEFQLYWLNEMGAGMRGNIFTDEEIDACIRQTPYPILPDQVKQIVPDCVAKTFVFSLDRAQPFSKHGDLTVGVVAAKCLTAEGKIVYLVCDMRVFPTGVADEILTYLRSILQIYPLEALVFETYQSFDLFHQISEEGYPAELLHVTDEKKRLAFQLLQSLVRSQKLIVPADADELIRELRRLEFAGGKYRAPTGEHDDAVYALVWSLKKLSEIPLSEPVFAWL